MVEVSLSALVAFVLSGYAIYRHRRLSREEQRRVLSERIHTICDH